MPKPLLCNPKPFKDQFRRDTKERKERRYCFILGAGASVSSGIPSGKALADQWLRELFERQCPASSPGKPPMTLDEWCAGNGCPVQGVDPKNPGAHYPQLFLARFPGGDPEGQRFIQEAIRGANPNHPNVPSVGYAYLALILQQTDSRVVITTNFDNLAADALLLFTGSLPRVVGHERIAAFAGLRDGQPLIAKIHGDVGFVTTNDPAGVSKLHEDWATPLREIFRDHIPVFIGYDGNDGSLMDFLCEKLFETEPGKPARSLFRSGLYWCYRAGEGKDWKSKVAANPRLQKLTEAHQVHFVPMGDFDLWLMELGIACDVGDPEQVLRGNVERRVKALAEQIGKARGDQALPAPSPEVEESRDTARKEIGSERKEWELAYQAQKEKDPEKADQLYREALAIAPNSPGILGNYAIFLKNNRKDYAQAQKLYERAIAADPSHSNNLGNYANFLHLIVKDYDRAEELFKRAIKASQNPTQHQANYANFLTNIRKQHDEAEELYKAVLNSDSNHTITLGNYALFLESIRQNYDRAEELYNRALELDPSHTNHLGNYACFLTRIRHEHDKAQRLFERAIKIDPDIAPNLGNFANFLRNVRKDYDRAQELYERAIELDPDSASELGNYALFLTENRKEHNRAQELYERALKCDPNLAIHLGNYANFLTRIRNDHARAQEFYERALKIDGASVNILSGYANFLYEIRKDNDRAQELYERAMAVDSSDAINLGNYALFLSKVRHDYDRAQELFEMGISLDPKQSNIVGNYALFLCNIRHQYDLAQEYYEQALENEPNHANHLGNYALLLTSIRHDHDGAQKFYERALIADPNHDNNLSNYALFLTSIRKDDIRAQELYERALKANPANANTFGNYVGLLLAISYDSNGLSLLNQAIAMPRVGCPPGLEVELWFYAFVHRPKEQRHEAIERLKALIMLGNRSPGWDFSRNIQRATECGHPDSAWLPLLAQVITGEASPTRLDAWDTWKSV